MSGNNEVPLDETRSLMSEQSTSEAVGESQDTAVTVSRLVSKPLKSVWMSLMTNAGAEALLGEGGQLPDKGHAWRSSGGAHGVTRSFHPLEQIRFTWHEDDDAPATLVDLKLAPEGDDTRVTIEHSHLPADLDRDKLAGRWEAAFDRILSATMD